jgi:phosphoribosyl-ATP pyrophosphohydrolase
MSHEATIFHRLMAVIEDRKQCPSPRSYTCQLFEAGPLHIGAKLASEAAEAAEAASEPGEIGQAHLVHEAADVLYHLLVLLASRSASLQDVERELTRRFGISGLDEKAARGELH